MDRLSAMEVFVAVASHGSFSAAAVALGMSKSAVSKHLAALEDRLGARLLNRTTRRLSLTDAGATYLEHSNRIIAEAEAAEAEVSCLSSEPRGSLRLAVPLVFGNDHLGPLLPEFLRRYPGVSLDVSMEDRHVDVVHEGFDLAVRITDLADSSLIARRLSTVRTVLVASPAYLEQAGTPQEPADLRRHPCLHYHQRSLGAEWRLVNSASRQSVQVRPGEGPLKANNGELIRLAAVAGHGIALQPTFIAGADMAAGRLVRVLPDWEGVSGALYLLWPHARLTPAKVRAFIDFMVEKAASMDL